MLKVTDSIKVSDFKLQTEDLFASFVSMCGGFITNTSLLAYFKRSLN
jgi:hypothetical protein